VVNAAESLRNARRVESSAASELGARNAGIRRAVGEFVLSTRIDASFPDSLIEFLAARPLERGRLYGMDRREESGAASGAGIRFGVGWYPLQHDEGGAFRWMENDAELILDTQPGGGILRIELEPGPGLGASPQPLQVIDSSGAQLAEWSIAGRDTVRIHIPPSTNGPQRIRLRTPTGGRPVIDDPRILNLRILRCEWVETGGGVARAPGAWWWWGGERGVRLLGAHRSGGVGLVQKAVRLLGMRGDDVFDAMCEFEPGVGWHYLEREGNAKFRWTEPKSELHVCFDDGSTHLAMLVEPGPSIGYRAFDLAVRMPDGKMAGNVHIAGLTYVEIPLPVPPGIAAKVQFEVEGAASSGSAAGDSRALAYRVLACGRGPFRNPKARTDPARNACIAHTIRTRPPAMDWQKKLAAQEKEITEMGRPACLHTATCGDFQLMAREHWYDLRGYTEFEQAAENVDALLAYQAYHLGLSETRLAVGD